MAEILAATGDLTAADLTAAAERGDPGPARCSPALAASWAARWPRWPR